jgi:membrane-associated phospholipid phosphatase
VYLQNIQSQAVHYNMRFCLQLILFVSMSSIATAQVTRVDSLIAAKDSSIAIFSKRSMIKDYHPSVAGIVVPAVMVGYGFVALKSETLIKFNKSTREEVHDEFRTTADNYMKSAPILAVYALNLAGIHGKHNFRDRTILLGMSSLLMMSTVGILKNSTHILRPDGSTYNSFPSGHTSTAFMSAEFMRQEYKDVSPWYGVAGYAVATATGVCRLYNNRHWVSDVVTGAGIGILSTKAAYWAFPKLQRLFTPKSSMTTMVMPTYNAEWKTAGISLVFFPK